MSIEERTLLSPHRKAKEEVTFYKHIIFSGIKLDISKDDLEGKYCNSIALTEERDIVMIDNIAVINCQCFFICRNMLYSNLVHNSQNLLQFKAFAKKQILVKFEQVQRKKFLFLPAVHSNRMSIICVMPNLHEVE